MGLGLMNLLFFIFNNLNIFFEVISNLQVGRFGFIIFVVNVSLSFSLNFYYLDIQF